MTLLLPQLVFGLGPDAGRDLASATFMVCSHLASRATLGAKLLNGGPRPSPRRRALLARPSFAPWPLCVFCAGLRAGGRCCSVSRRRRAGRATPSCRPPLADDEK